MLENVSAKAVIPKARAIFARHITYAEYTELMRRRTVPEVAQYLKAHPYFKDSLSGLSESSTRRGQLEELLSRDIYYKYESLVKFCFEQNGFGNIFLIDCEITELLSKLQDIATGLNDKYIARMPAFLMGKASFDLLKLAKANTFSDCLKVVANTPYNKVLQPFLPADNANLDYLGIEAALKSFYYQTALQMAQKQFHGQNLKDIESLYKMEAEIYNLDLIFRTKAFFTQALTVQRLKELVLPVRYHITAKKLQQLIAADSLDAFISAYEAGNLKKAYGKVKPKKGFTQTGQVMYTKAKQILHFTASPYTAMSAVLMLAKLERSNIINIIEGVRYKMPPEKIERFIKY